jgi:hypothetical protein
MGASGFHSLSLRSVFGKESSVGRGLVKREGGAHRGQLGGKIDRLDGNLGGFLRLARFFKETALFEGVLVKLRLFLDRRDGIGEVA